MSATPQAALRACIARMSDLVCDIDYLKNSIVDAAQRERIERAVAEIHAVASEVDASNGFGLYGLCVSHEPVAS